MKLRVFDNAQLFFLSEAAHPPHEYQEKAERELDRDSGAGTAAKANCRIGLSS